MEIELAIKILDMSDQELAEILQQFRSEYSEAFYKLEEIIKDKL